jgi:hypothetical protein
MIGWIVEKISNWGWRMKWRRLRPVTTSASAPADRSARSEGRCTGSNRLSTRSAAPAGLVAADGRPAGADPSGPAPSSLGGAPVSCRNTSSSVGPRSASSLTPTPAPRSAEAASSISSRPSRGAGSVSWSKRSPGSGSPQPTPASTICASSR